MVVAKMSKSAVYAPESAIPKRRKKKRGKSKSKKEEEEESADTSSSIMRTPKKEYVLKLGEGGKNGLAIQQIRAAVDAMNAVIKAKKTDKEGLFEGAGQRVVVQVTGIKLPAKDAKSFISVRLPHSTLPDSRDVCLIVKDLEKGIRPDHEPTLHHFNQLLEDKDAKDLITRVLPLRQLKVEMKTFEAKTAFCHSHDKFLADERILRLLPMFLGKQFLKRKRFPIGVSLTGGNLRGEIEAALRTNHLPLDSSGTCAMIEVGHTGMDSQKLVENVAAVAKLLVKKYPGGWRNLRGLHLKAENTFSIPMHVSTTSPNEIKLAPSQKTKDKTVSGELSTWPGMEVTVMPRGGVRIQRKADPEWDNEKDEPFIDGSDIEEEEEQEKMSEESGQKRKAKDNAKEKAKKRKKKNEADGDSSNSDDEDLVDAELEYMKKVAEEEEAMEKKEAESKAEEKKSKKKAKKVQESEEESSSDDEVEAAEDEYLGRNNQDEESDEEEEESDFDDDQELEDDDVVKDNSEESDEESDDDDDAKLLLNANDQEEEESDSE